MMMANARTLSVLALLLTLFRVCDGFSLIASTRQLSRSHALSHTLFLSNWKKKEKLVITARSLSLSESASLSPSLTSCNQEDVCQQVVDQDMSSSCSSCCSSSVTVDVRSPGEYLQGHIPGSFNVPLFSDEERAIVGE